jgi:DNA-binding MarR family transcriptional regulator
MRIEEEIKQSSFKSEYEKAVINILFTGNWLNLRQSQVFKSFGITTQQYNVLRILRGRKGEAATVKLLNERMLDKSSNVSRLVDKLVQKKWAVRKFNTSDRRQVDIFITTEGMELLEQIKAETPTLEQLLKGLDSDQLTQLSATLDSLRETFAENSEKA